jgi:hypothetical protein
MNECLEIKLLYIIINFIEHTCYEGLVVRSNKPVYDLITHSIYC